MGSINQQQVMRKKYIILILLLIEVQVNLYSLPRRNEIDVFLCVNNKKEYVSYLKDTVCVPYLVIRYRNNTNKSFYFSSLYHSSNSVPSFGYSLHAPAIDTTNVLFFLELYGSSMDSSYLFLYQPEEFYYRMLGISSEFDGDYCMDAGPINEALTVFYDQLCSCDKNEEKQYNTRTNGHLRNRIKYPSFVFLKGNEVVEQEINMLGLKLSKGKYIIEASSQSSGRVRYRWNKTRRLPKKVRRYRLYEGQLLSNVLIMDFREENL